MRYSRNIFEFSVQKYIRNRNFSLLDKIFVDQCYQGLSQGLSHSELQKWRRGTESLRNLNAVGSVPDVSSLPFPQLWFFQILETFLCYRHIPARSLHRPPNPNSVTTWKKNVNPRRRNKCIILDHINTVIWPCICLCSNPVTWPGLPAGHFDQSNRPEISACVWLFFCYYTVYNTKTKRMLPYLQNSPCNYLHADLRLMVLIRGSISKALS